VSIPKLNVSFSLTVIMPSGMVVFDTTNALSGFVASVKWKKTRQH
jgi:hypothetical protein